MLKIYKVFLSLALGLTLFTKSALGNTSKGFNEKLESLKWVAYAPANFDPTKGIYPSLDSIKEDLSLLYACGFGGIVTYGADNILGQVPRLAREIGFSGIIMGIWDIKNKEEIANAVAASAYIDGYCAGNEGLYARYDLDTLKKVIAELKQGTGKPVTTTEQIYDYYKDEIFFIGDWVFPNIHPFLSEVKDPKKGTLWIERHYRILKKHCPVDRIILFKEVGFPTAGMLMANEANQKEFFLNMEKTGVPFVYFEALDQKWKQHLPCEPYWGLFNYKRRPKQFILSIKKE